MTTLTRAEATAVLLNDQAQHYHYWLAYVAELRSTFEARTTPSSPDALTLPLHTAARRAITADLPLPIRQAFASEVERRRRDAQVAAEDAARRTQTPASSVDAVEQTLLDELDAELRGERDGRGRPVFWYNGVADAFDVGAVQAATTDADYAVLAPKPWSWGRVRNWWQGRTRTTKMTLGLVALLAVLVPLGWTAQLLFGEDGTAAKTPSAPPPAPLVAQTPVPLWKVQRIGLGGREEATEGVGLGLPLRLCVPAIQQSFVVVGASVVLTGTEGVRTYQIGDDVKRPDLVLADCRKAATPTLGAALLISTTTDVTLPEGTVLGITAVAADTDPEHIPSDRTAIEIEVRKSAGQAAQLVLADGTRQSLVSATPTERGFRLRFLVPAFTAPLAAGLVMPGAVPAHQAVTLPVPTTRAAVLREALTVETMGAVVRKDTLLLTMTVRLKDGASAVTLRASDLVVMANDRAIAGVRWTPPAVRGTSTTTIPITIPVGQIRSPLDVALGGKQVRLRWQSKSGS